MAQYDDGIVINGDCLEVLRTLPDDSVDSMVTDPPYELGFMGKQWDGSGVAYSIELWAEVLRVLKPGGHLLAFGGTRTYHRMVCAIEDAGFEVRDSIHWIYGSGFPKSLDVSKAIDKAAGATREVVGSKLGQPGYSLAPSTGGNLYEGSFGGTGDPSKECAITAPATPEAEQWQGWGTALKPAHEPIVVARKPLAGTVAANVLAHGTGALNIDGCRVQMSDRDRNVINNMGGFGEAGWTTDNGSALQGRVDGSLASLGAKAHDGGRWPANIVLGEPAAAEMDEQSGTTVSKASAGRQTAKQGTATLGDFTGTDKIAGHNDTGGASRFFPVFRYQAKAPTSERPVGPDGTKHPTVKPLALMRWLVRLVTPPGGVVLDPFAGSGTTLQAAREEGFRFIGVELTPEYMALIDSRLTKD